jgi:hypothetical protein
MATTTTSTVGSPIYLGKPITEIWRTDCKGDCNRKNCLNRLNVFVNLKEDEKDKKQNGRHVERGDRLGENRIDHVVSLKVYIMIAQLRASKLVHLMDCWIASQLWDPAAAPAPAPPRIMNLISLRLVTVTGGPFVPRTPPSLLSFLRTAALFFLLSRSLFIALSPTSTIVPRRRTFDYCSNAGRTGCCKASSRRGLRFRPCDTCPSAEAINHHDIAVGRHSPSYLSPLAVTHRLFLISPIFSLSPSPSPHLGITSSPLYSMAAATRARLAGSLVRSSRAPRARCPQIAAGPCAWTHYIRCRRQWWSWLE